jgi:hypothetical protein
MGEAIEWWGKAGQRSLERSAFVEAVGHFSRALAQIATLPATPALRREEIKLQVALIAPIIHVNGFAAPETKAAVNRANLLIERAEAMHEAPEDLVLLFSVLYGLWVAQAVAFNDSDLVLELAKQTLTLAERRGATVPRMIGHRLVGTSLLYTGDLVESREHLGQVVELYDSAEHRELATRLGHDLRAAALTFRSWALWLLGFPEAGLADAERALTDARELGQAGTLMLVLTITSVTRIFCGNYAIAVRSSDEPYCNGRPKGRGSVEGLGNASSRPRPRSQRQDRRGGPHHLFRYQRITIDRRRIPAAALLIRFGLGPCGACSIR